MGITTSSNDDVRGERERGLDFTLDLPQAILWNKPNIRVCEGFDSARLSKGRRDGLDIVGLARNGP